MQKSVLLKQTNSKYYLAVHCTGGNLFIIGNFLTDDISTRGDSFRSWLYDDSQQASSSNITAFFKTKENTIILSDIFIEDEDYYVELTKEQLINMLDNWKQIIVHEPAGILITQNEKGDLNFQSIDQSDEFLNSFSSSVAYQNHKS